jgi:hypothetical protein
LLLSCSEHAHRRRGGEAEAETSESNGVMNTIMKERRGGKRVVRMMRGDGLEESLRIIRGGRGRARSSASLLPVTVRCT